MSKRKATQYTEEFRSSSAKLAVESEQSMAATARELGLCQSTLYGWVAHYYPNHNKIKTLSEEEDTAQKLKRLMKENKRLRMERDILKKAAAFFAGETQ